jgi:hypothetical protein
MNFTYVYPCENKDPDDYDINIPILIAVFRIHFESLAVFKLCDSDSEDITSYYVDEHAFQSLMMTSGTKGSRMEPLHDKRGTYMNQYYQLSCFTNPKEDILYHRAVQVDHLFTNVTLEERQRLRKQHHMMGRPITLVHFGFIFFILDTIYNQFVDSVEVQDPPKYIGYDVWLKDLLSHQSLKCLTYDFIERMLLYKYESELIETTNGELCVYKWNIEPGWDVIPYWYTKVIEGLVEANEDILKKQEEIKDNLKKPKKAKGTLSESKLPEDTLITTLVPKRKT